MKHFENIRIVVEFLWFVEFSRQFDIVFASRLPLELELQFFSLHTVFDFCFKSIFLEDGLEPLSFYLSTSQTIIARKWCLNSSFPYHAKANLLEILQIFSIYYFFYLKWIKTVFTFIFETGKFCLNFTDLSHETTITDFLTKPRKRPHPRNTHMWKICKILAKLTRHKCMWGLKSNEHWKSEFVLLLFCQVTRTNWCHSLLLTNWKPLCSNRISLLWFSKSISILEYYLPILVNYNYL